MENVYSLFGPDNKEIEKEYQDLHSNQPELVAAAMASLKGRLRIATNLSVEWLQRTGFYEIYPVHPLLFEIALNAETIDANLATRAKVNGRPKEDHSIRDRLIKVLMDHELLSGTSKVTASDLVSVIIDSLPELETMSAGSVRNIHRRVTNEDQAAIEDLKK